MKRGLESKVNLFRIYFLIENLCFFCSLFFRDRLHDFQIGVLEGIAIVLMGVSLIYIILIIKTKILDS